MLIDWPSLLVHEVLRAYEPQAVRWAAVREAQAAAAADYTARRVTCRADLGFSGFTLARA